GYGDPGPARRDNAGNCREHSSRSAQERRPDLLDDIERNDLVDLLEHRAELGGALVERSLRPRAEDVSDSLAELQQAHVVRRAIDLLDLRTHFIEALRRRRELL